MDWGCCLCFLLVGDRGARDTEIFRSGGRWDGVFFFCSPTFARQRIRGRRAFGSTFFAGGAGTLLVSSLCEVNKDMLVLLDATTSRWRFHSPVVLDLFVLR